MPIKEIVTIVFNALIALGIFILVGIGKASFVQGIGALSCLLFPSAAPSLFQRLTDALGKDDPPRGPSIVGAAAFLGATATSAALLLACAPQAAKAPATSPPCQDAGLDVDDCAKAYTTDLAACTAMASTLAESQACEDNLRARYHRSARAVAFPVDAGAAPAPTDAGATRATDGGAS